MKIRPKRLSDIRALRNKILSIVIFLALSIISSAQRYDDYMDEEERADFERYAHLGLSNFEKISIAVGIVLLLIAFNAKMNEKLKMGIGCVGILAALPLAMVLLAVASKAVSYALIVAAIIGGLWYLFSGKWKD